MIVLAVLVWAAIPFVLWQTIKTQQRVNDYYKRNPRP